MRYTFDQMLKMKNMPLKLFRILKEENVQLENEIIILDGHYTLTAETEDQCVKWYERLKNRPELYDIKLGMYVADFIVTFKMKGE